MRTPPNGDFAQIRLVSMHAAHPNLEAPRSRSPDGARPCIWNAAEHRRSQTVQLAFCGSSAGRGPGRRSPRDRGSGPRCCTFLHVGIISSSTS